MAEVTRATQAGFSVLAQGEPAVRATQAGFVVVGRLAVPSPQRVTQAGFVVLAQGTSALRATQAGWSVVAIEPKPYIRAVAVSRTRIDLIMAPGDGATEHRLYRSTTPGFTPGAGTLIATYGAVPPATRQDTGLLTGTWYYYALSALVDGRWFTMRTAASTLGLAAPTLYVGQVTYSSGRLYVTQSAEYLEVDFRTTLAGDVVDAASQTGPVRWYRTVTGLDPETTYVSTARVRYAAGWSDWSDELEWTTLALGYVDPDSLGCPPSWTGIHVNPDGNHWDRIGRGFFRPLPGMPLRGKAAQIVFRWHTSVPRWNIQLSDDLGETWSTIASNVSASGTDGDRLARYAVTLDTTGYADDVDYRLRAVSTNTDPVLTWESMSFAIDNAQAIHWWKAQWGDPETNKWGKLWAQTGRDMWGGDTGDGIWVRGFDGGIAALAGHDYTLLVDRAIPESYGADVTVRWYLWSGEGGFFRAQGRDDLEFAKAGIGFFARGADSATKQGIFVGVGTFTANHLGCCSDYNTTVQVNIECAARQTPGVAMGTTYPDTDPDNPIEKLWAKALVKPYEVILQEGQFGQYGDLLTDLDVQWPMMTWRGGPEPGDGVQAAENTCGRRWEIYSQRTRVEVDPLDKSRVRIRVRMDGPGVVEPAAGYWHVDEWREFDEEWERGTTGLCSEQLAQSVYGTPMGARVFFSMSVLPLEPDEPPLIPPEELVPWYPVQEGAPCTVVLLVYDDDRETVRWEVGDDRLHPNPFLCVPEHYGEQELDIVNGAATIGQVEVVIVDRSQTVADQDSGWLTERLQLVHGRRNRLLRFIDYELGWVVIADGPATAPRMDDTYAAYRWTIRDTRETERKVEAFVAADTSWLLPMGVEDGFGAYVDPDGADQWLVPPSSPLVGNYRLADISLPWGESDGVARGWVDLRDYWPGPVPPSGWVVDEEIRVLEEVEKRLRSAGEPLGDPYPVYYEWPDTEVLWRVSGSGDPWTVVQPTDVVANYSSDTWPARPLAVCWDAWYEDDDSVRHKIRAASDILLRGQFAEGTFPDPETEVEIAIRHKGEPSEFAPLHIEGLTTGELLKNGYDGLYSRPDPITGEVVPTGIRYHEADLLQMTDPVRLRITEPVDDFRAWAEKMVYAPTGWVPALNNDGEISPKSQVPPISFAGELLIDNSVTEPQPDWSAGDRIVDIVTLAYPRLYRVPVEDATAVDRLEVREITQQYRNEAMIDRHNPQEADYDGSAFAALGDEFGEPVLTVRDEWGYLHALDRKLYVLDRYENGTPIIEVPVMRTHCATLRAGDWVRVDLSWFPENTTGRRGMLCGGQILAIHDVDCAWRILLIERVVPLIEGS